MNSSGAAPVPPSLPSTTMKSGRMPVASMALQIARNSHSWPTQSLKPVGLLPESSRRVATNCSNSLGVEKAEWLAGEMQSLPIGTWRMRAISSLPFAAGRTPPRAGLGPGLGALAELDLDHLDLIVGRGGGEEPGIEGAVELAGAEIAGAQLPDDVAAIPLVIRAVTTLTRVMGKAAQLGTLVQCKDGVGAQGAKAHRRDVEHRGVVDFAVTADIEPEMVVRH